jgi:hypothetical protein
MRHAIPLLLLVSCFAGASSQAKAQEEMILDESSGGVPVQTAILRRRYGPVATEQEVAGAELEAGYGATNLFKTIHWRRQFYRPWYGGFGWYGPRYYAGFGPRYVGYYPSFPYWPYWGGAWGGWGGRVWRILRRLRRLLWGLRRLLWRAVRFVLRSARFLWRLRWIRWMFLLVSAQPFRPTCLASVEFADG